MEGPFQPLAAASQTFATNLASFSSAYVLNLVLHFVSGEVSEKTIFTCAGIIMILYFFTLILLSPYLRGEKALTKRYR